MTPKQEFDNPKLTPTGIMYPTRPPFYAMKFLRILFESEALNGFGSEAALLLNFIAVREDSIRYCRAVTFWNSQLESVFGFKSPQKLNHARRRAVEAGWLVYFRESKRSIGHYATAIPDDIQATFIYQIRKENQNADDGLFSEYGKRTGKRTDVLFTEFGKLSYPVLPSPKPSNKRTTDSKDEKAKQPPLKKKAKASGDVEPPPGLDPQVWADWLAVRKAKRAGPVTRTAAIALEREARKAGLTVAQAIQICCERGWQSFRADWNWQDKSRRKGDSIHDIPTLSRPKRASEQTIDAEGSSQGNSEQ